MPEKIPVRTAFVVIALHRAHPHVRLGQACRNDDYVFQPLAGQIDALRECAAQNGQQSDLFLPLFKRAQQRVFSSSVIPRASRISAAPDMFRASSSAPTFSRYAYDGKNTMALPVVRRQLRLNRVSHERRARFPRGIAQIDGQNSRVQLAFVKRRGQSQTRVPVQTASMRLAASNGASVAEKKTAPRAFFVFSKMSCAAQSRNNSIRAVFSAPSVSTAYRSSSRPAAYCQQAAQ